MLNTEKKFHLIILNSNHIEQIVEIHLKAFKGFFLSSLGRKFLRTYYKSCLKNKSTISIGITDSNKIILGFAFGTLKSRGYHRSILINNIFSFSISLLRSIILKPSVLFRLIFNLNKNKKSETIFDCSELLSIGIIPSHSGFGLGKNLLLEFESRVKNSGSEAITLTTDFYDNDSVLQFYYKNNYLIYYDFIAYPNRRMYKLIKYFS